MHCKCGGEAPKASRSDDEQRSAPIVGHCQAPNKQITPVANAAGVFCLSGAMPYAHYLAEGHVTNRCSARAGLDVGYANARRVRTRGSDHCRSLPTPLDKPGTSPQHNTPLRGDRGFIYAECAPTSERSREALPIQNVGSDRRSDPQLRR